MTIAFAQPAANASLPFSAKPRVRAMTGSLVGKWLVIASVMFNPLLCLLDTKGVLHTSSAVVAVFELLIIFAATWYARKQIHPFAVILSGIIAAYVVAAHLINPAVSLKILHDLWVPYVFYILGTTSTFRTAKSTMWIIMALVLFFGFFELLALNVYGQFFNIWKYYVDKGALGADVINYQNTTSFVSGNRGADARTYLPSILGPARISSVFLEPVSLGNFATIVFAWGLSIWNRKSAKSLILLMALGFLCIVLSDSRFATACCVLLVLVRLTPLCRSSLFVISLPVLIATALTVVGSLHELPGVKPSIITDDFKGRLLFSGRLLDDWSLAPWFGFAASPVYVADTGYAYLFNSLGLPLTLVLFLVIAFRRNASSQAAVMKTMIALYFATSLCIGANGVTIKTGALLWFLYGALDGASKGSRGRGESAASGRPAGWLPQR